MPKSSIFFEKRRHFEFKKMKCAKIWVSSSSNLATSKRGPKNRLFEPQWYVLVIMEYWKCQSVCRDFPYLFARLLLTAQ
jgi:hypothetical protein